MHNLQTSRATTNMQASEPHDHEKRDGGHGTWPILLGDLTLTLVDRAGSSTPAFWPDKGSNEGSPSHIGHSTLEAAVTEPQARWKPKPPNHSTQEAEADQSPFDLDQPSHRTTNGDQRQ